VDATGTKLVPSLELPRRHLGHQARATANKHYAFDALLDDRFKLVTLMGKAGTGKTLMAMAAGLKRTVLDRNSAARRRAPDHFHGQGTRLPPGSLEEKTCAVVCSPFTTRSKMLSDPQTWATIIAVPPT